MQRGIRASQILLLRAYSFLRPLSVSLCCECSPRVEEGCGPCARQQLRQWFVECPHIRCASSRACPYSRRTSAPRHPFCPRSLNPDFSTPHVALLITFRPCFSSFSRKDDSTHRPSGGATCPGPVQARAGGATARDAHLGRCAAGCNVYCVYGGYHDGTSMPSRPFAAARASLTVRLGPVHAHRCPPHARHGGDSRRRHHRIQPR